MHRSVMEWFRDNVTQAEILGKRVLEVGALNVNGTVRDVIMPFKPKEYIGVDIVEGPGVDEVCDVCELVKRFRRNSFDVVISTEMLEHVEDWRTAVNQMKQVCKPGGLLLITTRSQGFHVHDYPGDYWRFEIDDMRKIFGECDIVVLEKDVKTHQGVLFKAKMGKYLSNKNMLEGIRLYSIRNYVFQKNRRFYQEVYKLKELSKLSKVSGGLVGAEIGVGEGTNLWWTTMLLSLKEYHVVDNFKPYSCDGKEMTVFAQYEQRVKGLFHHNNNVTVHVKDSLEAAKRFKDGYFDFIYLDGNYDEIGQDLAAWFPKLKTGGIIGGGGVPQVLETVKAIFGEVNVERHEWWQVV